MEQAFGFGAFAGFEIFRVQFSLKLCAKMRIGLAINLA